MWHSFFLNNKHFPFCKTIAENFTLIEEIKSQFFAVEFLAHKKIHIKNSEIRI